MRNLGIVFVCFETSLTSLILYREEHVSFANKSSQESETGCPQEAKKTEIGIKKGPSKLRRGPYLIQNDRVAINLKTETPVHPL